MTISREKCLEIGNAVYGHCHWNEAMLRRLEELCNRAYAEGQRDMLERAANAIEGQRYMLDALVEVKNLEVE